MNRLLAIAALMPAPLLAAGFSPHTATDKVPEVEEVQEVPGDNDFIPADDSPVPANPERIKRVEESVTAVLEPTDQEIREQKSFGVALLRGTASPWLGYGLDVAVLTSPVESVSMVVGSGKFYDQGEVAARSFEMRYESRTLGIAYRRFFADYEPLSVQLVVGYAVWDGRIIPAGADELSGDDQKLTASFEATGAYAGVSLGLNWFWQNGVYIQWEPVGMQYSTVLQLDTSRDSEAVDNAINRTIEPAAIYGLSNFKLGYLF